MKRRRLIALCALLVAAVALLIASKAGLVSAQSRRDRDQPPPPPYNPYPTGILPSHLDSEIARVLREIDVIEGRAIERWHSLPPPIRLQTRSGPNPPVLKDTGTESIETLGELMLFDKNMSPGRNQACTSCHMPYAGWSGPIPSVNLTIIAYPGTVHFRAGKRTPQRHTYAPFFPVLQYNQEQGLFFGGNFRDSRAT
jgi:cytochrome c peroxidase